MFRLPPCLLSARKKKGRALPVSVLRTCHSVVGFTRGPILFRYLLLLMLMMMMVTMMMLRRFQEFFQEENYAALAHVRERLDDFIRLMQSSRYVLLKQPAIQAFSGWCFADPIDARDAAFACIYYCFALALCRRSRPAVMGVEGKVTCPANFPRSTMEGSIESPAPASPYCSR